MGGLGAGKTTFARALLRAVAADALLEIQSPTFPLRIDHLLPRMKVVHADLYRIAAGEGLEEIGLDEALADAALVVEWPERLPQNLSAERLDIRLEIEGEGRRAEIVAAGSWVGRLQRSRIVRDFLDRSVGDVLRVPLAGDASYRAYERILPASSEGEWARAAILMNSPARIEGAKIYEGRSYDAVAHRAMDVRAFVAIDHGLRGAGIRAPEILSADMDAGVLLLEDLGDEGVLDSTGAPIMARYEAAIDLLVFMHARDWPTDAPLSQGTRYQIPSYDREALLIEVSLFPDWFGGHGGEPAFPLQGRDDFLNEWIKVLATIEGGENTWTLRDFHSPNILWQDNASGIARVGIIDFQDALIGHPAYDVASLAQDARADLSPDEERRLKGRYIEGRKAQDHRFDARAFERAYAILGLQRATKVLGIFTRLALAEGKPGYQRHRMRLKALIRHNLADPVLSPLRLWYEPYL
jgi:tRNA threonylcarbamoyl adenosine modification protein YjeE